MAIPAGKLALSAALLSLSVGLFAAHRHTGEETRQLAKVQALELGGGIEAQQRREALFKRALARLEERLLRDPNDYEASLLRGLIQFKRGHAGQALQVLEELTHRAPKFHLAHLIRGDLLLSRTRTVKDIGGAGLLSDAGFGDQEGLQRLREEAEARLKAYLDTLPQDRLPQSLVAIGPPVRTVIVVDKGAHRLYVYERDESGGPPVLVRDYYVSTGKLVGNKSIRGDLRTPEGVYFVTRHIPDRELPQKYGIGAYPLNYPNEWDRRQGKTGYGIWLHGTDKAFYSRPPLDSEGCVVLPNLDLGAVGERIRPGQTPVVITEEVNWLEREVWQRRRDELLQVVEQWRRDWESLDVERYLSHYSEAFRSGSHTKRTWSERKRRVAAGKKHQTIRLSDMSLFAYPSSAADRPLMVVNFHQSYRSNNFSSDMNKRLYLAREEGRWRIIYEGAQ